MTPLMEAYIETFERNHIDTEAIAQAANASPDLVSLITQIIEAKLQPYREMVVRLVKDLEDVNRALDEAHINSQDLESAIAAIKQTLINTQRMRLLYKHNHTQAIFQLL